LVKLVVIIVKDAEILLLGDSKGSFISSRGGQSVRWAGVIRNWGVVLDMLLQFCQAGVKAMDDVKNLTDITIGVGS
jgi:hypothetical protein